jgi:predicted Rossmann fold nucleotide-binding protein DprA/Smf involved in DNA uptake
MGFTIVSGLVRGAVTSKYTYYKYWGIIQELIAILRNRLFVNYPHKNKKLKKKSQKWAIISKFILNKKSGRISSPLKIE